MGSGASAPIPMASGASGCGPTPASRVWILACAATMCVASAASARCAAERSAPRVSRQEATINAGLGDLRCPEDPLSHTTCTDSDTEAVAMPPPGAPQDLQSAGPSHRSSKCTPAFSAPFSELDKCGQPAQGNRYCADGTWTRVEDCGRIPPNRAATRSDRCAQAHRPGPVRQKSPVECMP